VTATDEPTVDGPATRGGVAGGGVAGGGVAGNGVAGGGADPGNSTPAPPLTGLAAVVGAVDDRVDGWFEPLRGSPAIDGVAKAITGLGDHGLMWAATTVWRARHKGPERARSVRALAIAGVGSSLTNAGLKAVVQRARPDRSGLQVSPGGIPVREPKTSSFPSGHTLAAFCAATVMSRPGDRGGTALLFTSATLVGLSRVHLRAHHASDVVGGAAVGIAVGLIGRRLV
jgi:undecaprenyl-diphosphatase